MSATGAHGAGRAAPRALLITEDQDAGQRDPPPPARCVHAGSPPGHPCPTTPRGGRAAGGPGPHCGCLRGHRVAGTGRLAVGQPRRRVVGERGDHLQVWDYRRERGGFVDASRVRRSALGAGDAPELLAVLQQAIED